MQTANILSRFLYAFEEAIVCKKYISFVLASGSIFGFWANFSLSSLPLGIFLFSIYFIVITSFVGQIFFSQEKIGPRLLYGFSFSIALISLFGTIVYLIYDFSEVPMILTLLGFLVTTFCLLFWKQKTLTPNNYHSQINLEKTKKNSNKFRLVYILCLLLILSCYLLLYQSRTGESLTSIWDVIPFTFFVLLFIAACAVSYLIYFAKAGPNIGILLFLLALMSFLVAAVYLFVLKYPYPERGVATMVAEERKFTEFGKFIWWSGDVEKISASFFHKDIVYTTGYVMASISSKFLTLDPYYINLLIPLFFSFVLPISTYLLIVRLSPGDKRLGLFAGLAFLLSQHDIFILVPPTNWEVFSLVFLQFSIIFWVDFIRKKGRLLIPFFIASVFTIMTVFCHAYVGLYALIVAVVSIYLHYFSPFGTSPLSIKRLTSKITLDFDIKKFIRSKKKLLVFSILVIAIMLSLIPVYLVGNVLVFKQSEQTELMLNINLGKSMEIIFPPIWDDATLLILQRIFYLFINNFTYILYVLLTVGLFFCLKFHSDYAILVTVLILFSFSSMIIQNFLFPNMGWEREYYRFFYMMNFVTFPIIGLALHRTIKIISQKKKFLVLILIGLIALGLCASVYAGFPREGSMGPYGNNPKYISDYDVAAINYIKTQEKLDYPISFFIFGDTYTCSAAILQIGTPKLVNGTTRFDPYSSWQYPDLWSELLDTPSLKPFEYVEAQTGAKNIYLVLSYRISMESNEEFERALASYKVLFKETVFEIPNKIYVFKYQPYVESGLATVIVDKGQANFWSVNNIGVGTKGLQMSFQSSAENSTLNSLHVEITEGNYSHFHLYHHYSEPQNWSGNDLFVFSFNGTNSGNPFYIVIRGPSSSDYFSYEVTDDFSGWCRVVIPFGAFTRYGTISWGNVRELLVLLGNDWSLGNEIYLHRFVLDVRQID